jgi:multiple sugar transport system ATP-binding protein
MDDGVRLPLPVNATGEGRRVSYGIRPEHIRLSDQGVAGVIHLVEPTGAATEVVVQAGNQQITIVAHERLAVRPGQQVNLAIDVSEICLFDAEGKRIAAGATAS